MPSLRADAGASRAPVDAADLSQPESARLDAGGDGYQVSDESRQVELPLEWWSDDELAVIVAWQKEIEKDT